MEVVVFVLIVLAGVLVLHFRDLIREEHKKREASRAKALEPAQAICTCPYCKTELPQTPLLGQQVVCPKCSSTFKAAPKWMTSLDGVVTVSHLVIGIVYIVIGILLWKLANSL